MSYTVETINIKISEKINNAKLAALTILDFLSLDIFSDISPDVRADNIYQELSELEIKYNLSVINVLSNYYISCSGNAEKSNTDDYYKLITRESFIPKINECISGLSGIVDILIFHMNKKIPDIPEGKQWMGSISLQNNDNYTELLKMKKHLTGLISNNMNSEIYSLYLFSGDICTCENTSASIDVFDNKCYACGRINSQEKNIVITGQKDGRTIVNNKVKNNGYDPDRHFDDWMNDILAEGNFDFLPEQWESIDYIISRDKPKLTYIEEARDILKEIKLTKYNNHASLIMKKRGNNPPPKISGKVRKNASMLFDHIVKLLDQVMEEEKRTGNRPYYPHFIYFIFDIEANRAVTDGRMDDYRAIRDLQKRYIYLQSNKTMVRNDSRLSKICELDKKISDEEFEKTGIRREYLEFRPTIKRIKN